MRARILLTFSAAAILLAACDRGRTYRSVLREPLPQEKHLRNLRQLTFEGQNAEAYWSWDASQIVFQAQVGSPAADQIFIMPAQGGTPRMVSTGTGRTTCAFFLPGDERILFASTHLSGPDARPTPRDRALGYVWPVWSQYDLFTVRTDGTDLKRLTDSPGYDAEATVSPKGDKIVFTSTRDGDLEIYSMNLDGSDVKRLTHTPGYDGGAVFSPDGTKIVWRAARPTGEKLKRDQELLLKDLVKPEALDLWLMNADGSDQHKLTDNGAANFGPYWHPDGRRVIFSSNLHDPTGFNFELYLVDVETKATERVTWFERTRTHGERKWSDDFDGFPMFSRDGKRLVFCSNRNNERPNETNVFTCDWVD